MAIILSWGCEGADYLYLLGMRVTGLVTLYILRYGGERVEGVVAPAGPEAEAVNCTGYPSFHAGYL